MVVCTSNREDGCIHPDNGYPKYDGKQLKYVVSFVLEALETLVNWLAEETTHTHTNTHCKRFGELEQNIITTPN
jgi:hypothetical protein